MSLHWTIIAAVLYVEIAILFLFLLTPCISAQRWNRLFRSRFYETFSRQARWYYKFLFGVLTIFLCESVREMRKYSQPASEPILVPHHHHQHLDKEMQTNMRLFRAQRNFYITGGALFLSFVIGRLASLTIEQARLEAQCRASAGQAESAGKMAQSAVVDNHSDGDSILRLRRELELATVDRETARCQLLARSHEYYSLENEHEALQQQQQPSERSKKDD